MKVKVIVVFLCAAVALCNAAQTKNWITPMEMTPSKKPGGTTSITGQIIAGSPAILGQFPWQAALYIVKPAGNYLCGGSLIHPQWVLSAAHCTTGATSIQVRLGTLTRNTAGYIASSAIFTHEYYSSTNLNNDTGLIKLSVAADVSGPNIKVIKLASAGTTFTDLMVSGWGRTCDACNSSLTLNYAYVKAITNTQCSNNYGSSVVTSNTVCTMGSTSAKESTCQGDSGGPLVLNGTIPTLVGVVSFVSSTGCQAGKPAGYIRIAGFCPWIKSKIPDLQLASCI